MVDMTKTLGRPEAEPFVTLRSKGEQAARQGHTGRVQSGYSQQAGDVKAAGGSCL